STGAAGRRAAPPASPRGPHDRVEADLPKLPARLTPDDARRIHQRRARDRRRGRQAPGPQRRGLATGAARRRGRVRLRRRRRRRGTPARVLLFIATPRPTGLFASLASGPGPQPPGGPAAPRRPAARTAG